MRSSFAVFLVAAVLPRTGGQGCGAEPGPTEIRIDGLPDGRDVIVACHASEDVARSFVPAERADPASLLTVDAPCLLYAYRRDGALFRRSAPIQVHPGDDHVTVALAPEPVAGIGITFDPREDGVHVVGVLPLGPADGALQRGDVIVSVDGRPTMGMERWDFITLGTGEAGTWVVLEVDEPPLGRWSVAVVRATIGIDDDQEGDRRRVEVGAQAPALRRCLPATLPVVDLDLGF